MATTNKAVDFDSMNDEELLKQEQQMKDMLEKLAQAKLTRQESMKEKAFEEIATVLEKYIGTVLNEGVFTDWLIEHQYVVRHMIPVASSTSTGAQVGRRAIKDEDIIFAMPYKNEDGTREMTLKLDEMSKYPVIAKSGTALQLKAIKEKSFEELKEFFTNKFEEFKDTENGKKWVKLFFPAQFNEIYKIEVEVKAEEVATA